MPSLLTICELGRLGDIVASEPIVRHLRAAHPDRHLIFYTKECFAELVRYSPDIDEVITVRNADEYLQRKAALPEGTLSFELNLHLRGQRVAAQPRLDHFGIPLFPSLLEQFSSDAGVTVPDTTPVFHFNPDLPPLDLPEKYVAFHCVANGKRRNLPETHWRSLATMFLDAGWTVVEIGANAILRLPHPNFIDRTGLINLQVAAQLIANARLLVGVESGFGHIANAVGTFAIILTGQLHDYPEYNVYSGRFKKGDGCNLVRFYNLPAGELPLKVPQTVIRRYLDNSPMTNAECTDFCLKEQIRQLHANWFYRLTRWITSPWRAIIQSIRFHYMRHH